MGVDLIVDKTAKLKKIKIIQFSVLFYVDVFFFGSKFVQLEFASMHTGH